MEYAINSYTGKKIRASDPTTLKGPHYICPNCRSPVFLRKGAGKVAHFAHNSHQAKAYCELYMHSEDEKTSSVYKGVSEAPYRTLSLYLKLVEEHKNPIKWSLELNIPEPDIDLGRILIPFALGGQRIIPVSSIKSGGMRVGILPGVSPFTILHDNVPEGRWRTRILQPIPGLKKEGINAFRYSPFGGRLLKEDKPFYWGRSYIFLWTSNFSPAWWPSEKIMETLPLRGYTAWNGVYVQFPTCYNQQVEKWVNEYTGRAIMHPPAELELITPLPEYRLSDGTYVIQNGKKVALGIIGEPGARKWNKVYCYDSNTEQTESIFGKGIVPSVFQVQLDAGRKVFWLDDDIENSVQIIVNSKEEFVLNNPGVKFFVMDNGSSEEQEVLLHNKEVEQIISRAFEGNVKFTNVQLPSYTNITLHWIDSNKAEQAISRTVKDNIEETHSFEKKMLNLLNSLSTHKLGYLSIDAGVFGSVKVDKRLKSDEKAIEGLDMGDKWRQRVLYLLNLSKTKTNGQFIDIHRNLNISLFSFKDQKLLRRLALQKRWPIELAPYYLSLLNESQRVINLKRRGE